ncbi:MAG: hypothetical protein VYE68_06010, partial [Acidobacteriota bacterium]|nr:hypothetical protein [Acidobacteriota bacterium]
YPTSATVPANLLRLYVEFSGAMSVRGGGEHVRLLDEDNQVVAAPFLPLDLALWNEDRTRYTLLFEPGRVKRGILPNREVGPALVEGQTYTLVFDRGWLDEAGMPLKQEFTRPLTVGAPQHHAIDPTRWGISPPPAGTRDPLEVSLPSSLDYGLLQRALRIVNAGGVGLTGAVAIGEAETVWTFTPAMPWASEEHMLVALPTLEDPAGNRIGRAFEVATSERLGPGDRHTGARIPFYPTLSR